MYVQDSPTNKLYEDNEWWTGYANHRMKQCHVSLGKCWHDIVQNSVPFDSFCLKTVWTDQYFSFSCVLRIMGCWVLPYKVICTAILKAGFDITPVQPPESVSVYGICQNYQDTWTCRWAQHPMSINTDSWYECTQSLSLVQMGLCTHNHSQ